MSGSKTELKHEQFFLFRCPRPKEDTYGQCLLSKWGEMVSDLQNIEHDIHKIIKGRKGEREVDLLLLNDILQDLEEKVRERLLETEEGIMFLEQEHRRGLKMVVFCVLGCQKILNEHYKRGRNLGESKAQIIYEVLRRYYLLEDTNICNATIQEIEEQFEKRKKQKKEDNRYEGKQEPVTTNSHIEEENDPLIQRTDSGNDFLDNWDDFSRENKSNELDTKDENETTSIEALENAVIEVSEIESDDFLSLSEQELEQINFSTVENYFIKGDRELTETLIDYCPKIDDEKYDMTCDTCDDTYYLASNKIVHLFIYQNELFKDIDLSADCLLEQEVDVKELRRLVELHIRKHTKWELSKKKKDKFVLCTLCHKIREYKRLGQIDLLTAVKAFFIFMGKIYQLPEEELKQKMEEVIHKLRLDEPKVIGKVEHIEKKPLSELLKDILNDGLSDSLNSRLNDKEDVYAFLKSVWEANPHLETKTEEEIAEQRRRAKRIVKERRQLFKKIWEDNDEFRPYLAVELLNELKKQPEKDTQKEDTTIISQKEIELYKQQCNECRKTIDFDICLKRAEEVMKAVTEGDKETQELWKTREDLRPCLANRLSE